VIFIVVKFNVRPESVDQFVESARSFAENVREEPGNLWFEWSRSLDNPNQFVLIEAFSDAQAGAEHVGMDYFQEAMRRQRPMLVDIPDIVNVEVPGTEWSKLVEMAPEG
jgi:quinol monooxygenase YgiN